MWDRGAEPSQVRLREPLRVSHIRPHGSLDVRKNLSQVVGVVMDPLVQQVGHPQESDDRMHSTSLQIGVSEACGEISGLGPKRGKLADQLLRVSRAVLPSSGHSRLVPSDEPRLILVQDLADAAGEASSLSLDEVTDHLVDAPLARGWVPGQEAVWHSPELKLRRSAELADDLGDGLGGKGAGARGRIGHVHATIAGGHVTADLRSRVVTSSAF